MFKEDLELREKVFKRMGWELTSLNYFGLHWKYPDMPVLTAGNVIWEDELPPIETDWQVTAQYLLPFMRGKGFGYELLENESGIKVYFHWMPRHIHSGCSTSEIINDNIALAACQAFLEVNHD